MGQTLCAFPVSGFPFRFLSHEPVFMGQKPEDGQVHGAKTGRQTG